MKKIIKKELLKFKPMLALLLILCISFHSCKEKDTDDKPYVPEQKIKRLHSGNTLSETKDLFQEWFWEDNKIKKIDYYPREIITANTAHYFYEKDRLVKVEENNGYFLMFYTNSKLSKIEHFRFNLNYMVAKWDFYYENEKVSKIDYHFDDDFGVDKIGKGGFLSSLIPQEFITHIKNVSKGKNKTVAIFTYQYAGDNIKEMSLRIPESGTLLTLIYNSYDDKINPFYKQLLFNYEGLLYSELVNSRNNPLVSETYINNSLRSKSNFLYKYEQNFPVERVQTNYNIKTYYEYE